MRYLILPLLIVLLVTPVTAQTESFELVGVPYTVERVTAANYPVALAYAPDGRLFYTEKTTGNVRVISADGDLQAEPVITLEVDALAERGLIGITIDPDYPDNGHIWVFRTAPATARDFPTNQVVRFTEQDGTGSDPEVMLSVTITEGTLIHNGGNLHFHDDGTLFVSIGDYENAANSQDMTTPQGAIHRFDVTDEGLVPAAGNPFEDSSIYAYGVRNSFDFDFDNETHHIFATENGQHCDDEVNVILPGFNYGAGEGYVCGDHAPGIDELFYLPGMLSFTPTQAPTGIVVYDHEAVPEWQGNVFFCVWNDGVPSLRMITLNEARIGVESVTEVALGEARCRIDITVSPDGDLVFTTVGSDGGAIWRLRPGV